MKKKYAVITAASSGIGQSLVNKFHENGYKVIATYYKNKPSLNLLGVEYFKCDLSKSTGRLSFIDFVKSRSDYVDILINNYGDAIKRTKSVDSSLDLWRKTFDINLFSAVQITNGLIDLILKSDNKTVISISSIATRTFGGGDSLHYACAKSALNTYVAGMAKEIGNIKFINIAPSAVNTEFQKKYSDESRLKKIIDSTPLGRICEPNEVAEMAFFLASKQCSYISGETIFMTGGR
jgi:NAD(P)-dependent dehydrogenase (short-subunit alcohol dehydrogenase family)